MLGAIIGDICGSVYEWDNERDENKVVLFREDCHPTDDSIMTVAVCRALLDAEGMTDAAIRDSVITSMHYFGRLYPTSGYGGNFRNWLLHYSRSPYNSWGNGSAMRVSSVGWLYDTPEQTLHMAELTAAVTHNHEEGIKGALAIALAIYLARIGSSKEDIRECMEHFYCLDKTLDEIRPGYKFDESCQGSCPQAIEAFLEGNDFDDVIRKAISIGGDSDTIAAMAGGIAEAYYGIPKDIEKKAFKVLTQVKDGKRVFNNQILAEEVQRLRKYLEQEKQGK